MSSLQFWVDQQEETRLVGQIRPPIAGGDTVISATVLSGSQASIDIPNIPATFTALRIFALMRCDTVATFDSFKMQFNGDTGNNYDFGNAAGGSAGSSFGANATSGIAAHIQASTSTANRFSPVEILIPFYANTVTFKGATMTSYHWRAAGSFFGEAGGGEWLNTAAINRVTFVTTTGNNFSANTSVTLYGVK